MYEAFIEGAKEGFDVAKTLLPYLVAMLCAVGVLRASGALDFGLDGIRHLVQWAGWDTRFVDALPTALVKPFSGSAARAMLIETMKTSGVDSFPAMVAATIQGSTETTFYVLAVYFGAVGIQRARHAVGCALMAEFSGSWRRLGFATGSSAEPQSFASDGAPSVRRRRCETLALLQCPGHYFGRQPVTGPAKAVHHRRHFHIAQRLAHFKTATGQDALVEPAHQQRVQANHHGGRSALVFGLERLQLPAQLQVCLQVAVGDAQQPDASILGEAIEQAVAQQHRGRVAPARGGVAAEQIALGITAIFGLLSTSLAWGWPGAATSSPPCPQMPGPGWRASDTHSKVQPWAKSSNRLPGQILPAREEGG